MNFKEYNQQQNWLFPPSIEELIPAHHPVRIVNGVIETMDLSSLYEVYYKEGKPAFHPKMMLKIMVYAYMDNIYSSRKIEKAMRENINFMWLSAKQVADHNTIARFRSEKLKEVFKDLFAQVVMLLAQEGLLSLKKVYTDGTKIESVAGRYTFVWGNAIKTRKAKMAEQLEELWNYAQSIADQQDQDPPEPPSFKKISPEKIRQTAEKMSKIIKEKSTDAKRKAKARYIKKNFADRLEKYQQQEEILQSRNSYSKTDPDATFMRMKDDHMQNGQLKPGYNAQISTENQIIVNYTLHQDTNDLHTLKSHLQNHFELYGSLPQELTADAGYGSEENFKLLNEKGIKAYVKYPLFDKEQGTSKKKKTRNKPFDRDSLYYNKEEDYYVCPMGQVMEKSKEITKKTKSGYVQKYSCYTAKNCEGCPLRGVCFKAKGNRSIERNHPLEYYKARARENLLSATGVLRRKKRMADVEAVFAHLKHNRNFKRFSLKGLKKVELEFGLHALAHNLKKMVA
ncbi:IS1182 family transposase [Corynebacterium sp. TAE3-ERU30]|uniref:IS1182 family transposase n=1 Tax=Corynebacterium sp. TAE3-ERU30 TaxID=2849496 RepID=UPI001C44B3DB|nr:IS1182 family transposase [Corynebacterium sp. TAE3-ERU30]MBV7282860.1 IS1182 family transposase [Corynebacterium sp. TAE3-ERU30]